MNQKPQQMDRQMNQIPQQMNRLPQQMNQTPQQMNRLPQQNGGFVENIQSAWDELINNPEPHQGFIENLGDVANELVGGDNQGDMRFPRNQTGYQNPIQNRFQYTQRQNGY
jgi:hypothetical protein